MDTEKSSVFHLTKSSVQEMLAEKAAPGKNLREPLKGLAAEKALPFNIIELSCHTNKVEAHIYLHDLWHCLEGEVKFLCGGMMVEPYNRMQSDRTVDKTELRAKHLEGAQEITVKAGDWLWIPAGEPHQHMTKGTARLMIIKIPLG